MSEMNTDNHRPHPKNQYSHPYDLNVLSDKEALAATAADLFLSLAQKSAATGTNFTVALAGGSTPKALYSLLATAPRNQQIDWHRVHLYFGDERCVPPDSEESNYHMVRASLLASNPTIPAANLHRMPAEMPDHDMAARQYEETIRAIVPMNAAGLPRFDLILLGMGPDGHTASLFPHKPALHIIDRWVVASEPGLTPFVPRLTLTYPVLNSAKQVLFLVAGADKADTLARVLKGPVDPDTLPAQSVRPTDGILTWLVDTSAASNL